jgi:hypothetical protein
MSAYYKKYKIKSIDLWDHTLNVRVDPEKERSRNDVSVGPEKGVIVAGARLRCLWEDHRAPAVWYQ